MIKPADAPDTSLDLSALEGVFDKAVPDPNAPAPAVEPVVTLPAKQDEQVAKAVEPKVEEAADPNAKPWDKLKGEEPAKKEEPEPGKDDKKDDEIVEPKNMTKEARDTFGRLKFTNKTLKQQAVTAETKLAEAQKRLDELSAKAGPDEATLKELEDHRTYRAALEVKSTPEWKATISDPLDGIFTNLRKMATKAGVDPEKLVEATDITEDWERTLAIKEVFATAAEAVPPELVTLASQQADKLYPIYAKATELENNAQEVQRSMQGRTQQEKAAAEKAAAAEYDKHHQHIYDQLAAKLPTLFKNEELAKALRAERPATDPADQAFQAMSSRLLPAVVEELHTARAEITRLQASEKALLGTRAGVAKVVDAQTAKRPDDDDTGFDEAGLAAAFSTLRS